jgi:hypothetical protein
MVSTGSLVYKRPVLTSRARRLGFVLGLGYVGGVGPASGDQRVHPVRQEAPDLGYQVSLETRIHHAERTDFTRPVFLFNQRLDRVLVREWLTTLDFRMGLFPGLTLDAKLPVSWRQADVRFAPVAVSPDQVLPPVWRDLSSVGPTDTQVGFEYQFLREPFDLHLHAGTAIPGSDNPGSNTVASELPLSTGQTEIFLEASASTETQRFVLHGDYRIGYRPATAVAYLVRQVGNQSYASGALGDNFGHRLTLALSWRLDERFSFRLRPEWTIEENPGVIDHGIEFLVMPERLRHELALEGRFTIRIDEHNAFEAFYQHLFLRAWEKDPFFPIVVPERGFGIAWHGWSP